MKRTAHVARTAHDLSHVNRLHVPDFWILSLTLSAGGKSSKSFVMAGTPSGGDAGGADNTFHFAPEKETPELKYEIDDPRGVVRIAKLELFTRFDDKPLWTADLLKLGVNACTHGKHAIKWDGRVIKLPDDNPEGEEVKDITAIDPDLKIQADFPDGYVTVQHSPYKLRLSISDREDGKVSTAWTYFHVLVKKIELEMGPEKSLPKAATGKPDRDLAVYKESDTNALNGSLPGDTETKRVYLASNIFKNSNAQMHDRSDFTSYQTLWDDGPNIPVFAKVWISDSGDNAVEAPKALGKTKFLWNAEDVPESSGSIYGSHHAKAKTFLDAAVNYDKDVTKPKGENCHKDRGGKRGDATKTMFPKQDGYGYGHGGDFDSDAQQDALKDRQFPFKVELCKTRKWSSYSYAWTKGALANKTGVLFQPSRMGGDSYKVSIYLAFDKKDKTDLLIDAEEDEPLTNTNEAIKAKTGIFEVWRKLNFVQYMKKKTGVTPNFPIAKFQEYYEKAFTRMLNDSGAATNMTKATYDSRVVAAINARTNWYEKHMLSTTVASHWDAGNHGVHCNTFAQFKTAVKADQGWNNTELNAFLGTILNTEAKYNDFVGNVASDALTVVCEQYMHADPGINLFQFNEHYNLATLPGGSTLNGFAPGAAVGPNKNQTTNNQCFFVLCAGPTNYNGTNNKAEQTVAHEIGHCMFMAHAPVQTATDIANKHDRDVHDKDFNNCLMSYNYDQERKWCGFCILRFRGWDRAQLKNEAAQNKKP